jgi:acyl-CoA synthetase (AMP-forming)/AMP-acid ligase II
MNLWVEDLLARISARTALRIAASPGANPVHEYSGEGLRAAATALVEAQLPLGRRSVVLLLMPHCPELFLLHFGLVLTGHIPAILAWPTTRVDPEKYQRNLVHQLQRIPADRLITLPRLAENIRGSLPYEVSSCDTQGAASFEAVFRERFVAAAPPSSAPNTAPLPDDVLFLQFSGGTTGAQKCVPVTQEMLKAQLERLRLRLGFSPEDGVVSWLPMYHDMGLIACLWFPLYCGAPSLHFAASDWLLHPELLLKFLNLHKGTFTWLPNFAFAYLAQRRAAISSALNVSHVRGWINCSEPVRRSSINTFADAFAELGVSPEQLQSSYAMAENVFAVTQTDLGNAIRTVHRSRVTHSAVSPSEQAFELLDDVYNSSGRCLPDTRVRIVGGNGTMCADREAGEIQISSPSLFAGYWSADGIDSRSLSDGWYKTGDYGFCDAEELFVIGRLKDMIIVGGQNVFPEDLESIAAGVAGVRPGRVVAFGLDDPELGTQSLVVIAEMADGFDAEKASRMEQAIRGMISACLGLAARYVRVVPAPWIVKSTAGKISRNDTRARFLAELAEAG